MKTRDLSGHVSFSMHGTCRDLVRLRLRHSQRFLPHMLDAMDHSGAYFPLELSKGQRQRQRQTETERERQTDRDRQRQREAERERECVCVLCVFILVCMSVRRTIHVVRVCQSWGPTTLSVTHTYIDFLYILTLLCISKCVCRNIYTFIFLFPFLLQQGRG
jgi:hypothetical protein